MAGGTPEPVARVKPMDPGQPPLVPVEHLHRLGVAVGLGGLAGPARLHQDADVGPGVLQLGDVPGGRVGKPAGLGDPGEVRQLARVHQLGEGGIDQQPAVGVGQRPEGRIVLADEFVGERLQVEDVRGDGRRGFRREPVADLDRLPAGGYEVQGGPEAGRAAVGG